MKEEITNRIHTFFRKGNTWQFAAKMFVFLFLANLLLRLPLYFSTNFWFDGDEAIIGIMAQDVLKSGNISFFFYGQRYGFATVETLFTAFWIIFLGSKIVALKLAGMCIHSLALLFLSLTLRAKKMNSSTHLFLLCFLLLFPPFYLWAFQMRTTPFLLASLLFYLTATHGFSWKRYFVVFFVSFLLLEAQAMFFLFAMVFVGDWLWKSPYRWLSLLTLGVGLMMIVFALNIYSSAGKAAHAVQLNFGVEQVHQLLLQCKGFLSAFTGFHYFTTNIEMPTWYAWFSLVLIGVFLGLFFPKLMALRKENRTLLLFYTIATLAFLLFLSGFKEYGPRYWINFFGGSILMLLWGWSNTEIQQRMTKFHFLFLSLFAAVLFAAPNMRVHFSENKISEQAAFHALEREVVAAQRKALFTTDVYLQWQWNYLKGEDIPCCSFMRKDRTDRFSKRVFQQYKEEPNSVGLIGFWGIFWEMDFIPGFNDQRYQVGEKYYFLKNMQVEYFKRGLQVVQE